MKNDLHVDQMNAKGDAIKVVTSLYPKSSRIKYLSKTREKPWSQWICEALIFRFHYDW